MKILADQIVTEALKAVDCYTAGCRKNATHNLKIRVVATEHVAEFITDTDYCLDHALYFAAWLPHCYPGEFELISINPPASELFSR